VGAVGCVVVSPGSAGFELSATTTSVSLSFCQGRVQPLRVNSNKYTVKGITREDLFIKYKAKKYAGVC